MTYKTGIQSACLFQGERVDERFTKKALLGLIVSIGRISEDQWRKNESGNESI